MYEKRPEYTVVRAGVGLTMALGIMALANGHEQAAAPTVIKTSESAALAGPQVLPSSDREIEIPVVTTTTSTTEAPTTTTTTAPEHRAVHSVSRGTPRSTSSQPPETAPATASTASGRYIGDFLITCYQLRGQTASGSTVHDGTVAVDPAVIPLGAYLEIDGKQFHAEDTGSAVKGHHIDEWRPNCNGWPNPTLPVYRLP